MKTQDELVNSEGAETYREPSIDVVGTVEALTHGPVTVPTSETYGYRSGSVRQKPPDEDAP